MTTAIVHDDLAVVTTHEIECLAAEIFVNSYGMDWGEAIEEAFASVVDLMTSATDWDIRCAVAGNLDALG